MNPQQSRDRTRHIRCSRPMVHSTPVVPRQSMRIPVYGSGSGVGARVRLEKIIHSHIGGRDEANHDNGGGGRGRRDDGCLRSRQGGRKFRELLSGLKEAPQSSRPRHRHVQGDPQPRTNRDRLRVDLQRPRRRRHCRRTFTSASRRTRAKSSLWLCGWTRLPGLPERRRCNVSAPPDLRNGYGFGTLTAANVLAQTDNGSPTWEEVSR